MGVPGDSILYLQGELIQRAEGTSEEEISEIHENSTRYFFKMIKEINDDETLKSKLEEKFWNEYPLMSDEEKKRAR